ncbi:MAG: hypothetical protein K8S24_02960 [Candidatus Aegiribacteria sp.]|nr:hypothetical protein [Candidatus Aegiribacteria sp.]
MSTEFLRNGINCTIETIRNAQMFYSTPDILPENVTKEAHSACSEALRLLERALISLPGRKYSEILLDRMLGESDLTENNSIRLNDMELPFSVARTFAFQNYTTITWVIYDLAFQALDFWLCTWPHWRNNAEHSKLVKTIITMKGKDACAADSIHILDVYGLPISISYCIRNAFSHDGDTIAEGNIFESEHNDQGFRPSGEMIKYIKDWCSDKKITGKNTLQAEQWSWEIECLYALLQSSNGEIDKALNSIMAWTSAKIEKQIELLAVQ